MVTYRRFSHTDNMGYPRLERCSAPPECGYQQAFAIIPVVLATAPCADRVATRAIPPEISRLKAPTIPGAPSGLPKEFDMCVQENGMFIRHRDVNNKLHGAHVSASCWNDRETGMRMCRIDVGGDAELIVPTCIDEEVEKEPLPQICCVNIETSTLICPGSSYDGLVVKIVHDFKNEGVEIVSVEHPDLPGGGARLPVCENLEPDLEESPCCIYEKTGQLKCPESSVLAMYNGRLIPSRYYECKNRPDGSRVCIFKCGILGNPSNETERFLQHICQVSGRIEFPVCETPLSLSPVPQGPEEPKVPETRIPKPKQLSPVPVPRPKPKQLSPVPVPKKPERVPVPQLCCLNPETSSLVCEGTPYDGLVVQVVHRTTLSDGTEIASVQHPSIPGGGARVPVCSGIPPQRRPHPKLPPTHKEPPTRKEPPPPIVKLPPEPKLPPSPKHTPAPRLPRPTFLPENCCYNMETGLLECEGSKWHGMLVHPVSIGHIKDGVGMILVEHPKFIGGRASVPICGRSCFPTSDEGRAYAMTYRGTCPVCTGPSLRRYSGCGPARRYGGCEIIIDPFTGKETRYCDDIKDPFKSSSERKGKGVSSPIIITSRPLPTRGKKGPAGEVGARRFSGFSGRPSVVMSQIEGTMEYLDGRNRGFRPNSPGPNIHTLHQANLEVSPWGRVGHARPPNITGNPNGYNTRLFSNPDDVARAMAELGYYWKVDDKFLFSKAAKRFQSDYNFVVNQLPSYENLQRIKWIRAPRGNVVADGLVGPVTMNALEIALVNQRGGISWEQVVLISKEINRTGAREHLYNAIKG